MIANHQQVGGDHYRTPFQVWDMVDKLHLDYFEGAIVKYVTRHKKKGGAEDLQKALHYTRKMIELVLNSNKLPRHMFPTDGLLDDFAVANDLAAYEIKCIRTVCNWKSINDLMMLETMIAGLISERYEVKNDQ